MADAWDFFSSGPEETAAFARRLAGILGPSSVVAFYGDLGSGKTFICQSIAAALDVTEPVTSPSFTLVQEYRGRWPVYHFDFYRLHSLDEVVELGFQDYLDAEGLCLLEWPQVARPLLPPSTLHIEIELPADAQELEANRRRIRVLGLTETQRKALNS